MKLNLELDTANKEFSDIKEYKVVDFKPTNYFTYTFVVGESNKYKASRVVCTAYLTDLRVRTAKWRKKEVEFRCTFRFVFDAPGDNYVESFQDFCVNLGKNKNDKYFLDGLFNKVLYCDDIDLKSRMGTAVQQLNNWNSIISSHEDRQYEAKFGKIPYVNETNDIKMASTVNAESYNDKYDVIQWISIRPVAVSKYISYYLAELEAKANEDHYTEEDLSVYFDYLKRKIADSANSDSKLTDYSPNVGIQSFAYFAIQRRYAQENAIDFIKTKELADQLKLNLDEDVKQRFVADLYKIAEPGVIKLEKKTTAKKTTKKTTKKKTENVSENS